MPNPRISSKSRLKRLFQGDTDAILEEAGLPSTKPEIRWEITALPEEGTPEREELDRRRAAGEPTWFIVRKTNQHE